MATSVYHKNNNDLFMSALIERAEIGKTRFIKKYASRIIGLWI